MGLFVLIIVGVVVAQTWLDWRKSTSARVLPEWAKGIALGGVFAVSIAAMTSFATGWMQDPAAQLPTAMESRAFWPEAGLLTLVAGAIVLVARKKRMGWILLLAGLVVGAFWIGMSFGS